METIGNLWLYLAFFGIVAVMLLIDFLGFKQKEGQDVKIKTAAYWSIAWVTVASLFGGGLWLYLQQTAGVTVANTKVMEYFAGYLLEKSLAIDNVFVWLMIFAAFSIPPALQRPRPERSRSIFPVSIFPSRYIVCPITLIHTRQNRETCKGRKRTAISTITIIHKQPIRNR